MKYAALLHACLLIIVINDTLGKSVKDYITDGIAAGKECLHKGCFWQGLFPSFGKYNFPSIRVFDSSDMVGEDQPNCYRIPALMQHPQTGTLLAIAEARFGPNTGIFTACEDQSPLGLALKRSTDGGNTWSSATWAVPPTLTDPTDPTSNLGGNPVLVFSF